MDAGAFSCGVFIDLKKALDTVDHSILIHKLDFYGFRGINNVWFRSYSQDRTQITVVDQRLYNKSACCYVWGSPRFCTWTFTFSSVRVMYCVTSCDVCMLSLHIMG